MSLTVYLGETDDYAISEYGAAARRHFPNRSDEFDDTDHLVPRLDWSRHNAYIAIPLWLLAAICLAWPVTSFILARRSHKRGFPVEPTDASGSEAPKVRSNEAQGASPG